MAYGDNAVGRDGNRGIHAGSPSGDPAHMPDGWFASVGSFTAPSGGLGRPTMGQSRQDIPGSSEIQPREQYDFQSAGEPGLLGQDRDDYSSTLHDANYPSTPSPEFQGESGTTNMGPQGGPVDWNSVAPYEYPEYPMQSNASQVNASAAAVPLT